MVSTVVVCWLGSPEYPTVQVWVPLSGLEVPIGKVASGAGPISSACASDDPSPPDGIPLAPLPPLLALLQPTLAAVPSTRRRARATRAMSHSLSRRLRASCHSRLASARPVPSSARRRLLRAGVHGIRIRDEGNGPSAVSSKTAGAVEATVSANARVRPASAALLRTGARDDRRLRMAHIGGHGAAGSRRVARGDRGDPQP